MVGGEEEQARPPSPAKSAARDTNMPHRPPRAAACVKDSVDRGCYARIVGRCAAERDRQVDPPDEQRVDPLDRSVRVECRGFLNLGDDRDPLRSDRDVVVDSS